MTPTLILGCIAAFFVVLVTIAWLTSRKAGSHAYFLGEKKSPWYILAFGLIGESLSGVTFISVPGQVGLQQFGYFQMVLGYAIGYLIIAGVLLPLYYRLNLTSIYSYLFGRYGRFTQKTGSTFFLVSRLLGAAARLYLTAGVIQMFVFDAWGIPFAATVATIILLMLAYTFKGGIKTIVWTDTFLSSFLLLGLGLSIIIIARKLNLDFSGVAAKVYHGHYSEVFFWDWQPATFFPKQFIGGIVVAVCMTGLDQNLMQKNLSARSLGDAQKNIRWFALTIVIVNLAFLCLGALLHEFADAQGIAKPKNLDHLFPLLALEHMGILAAVVFIIGLTSATFASADAVLTTLTTSFCIDILDMEKQPAWNDAFKTKLRHKVHLLFALLLLDIILYFKVLGAQEVIILVLKLANYTYGPLLGLFFFGLFTRQRVRDRYVPLACLIPPVYCYALEMLAPAGLFGYRFGNELLLINGMLTAFGLWLARQQDGAAAGIER
jgi:Na+/proline symporter